MNGWNFAEVWSAVAERHPDAPALIHGDQRVTWAELRRRSLAIASWLVTERGLRRGDKVAQYLPNRPEYLESVFASFVACAAPVNTNFRYTGEELHHLWADADVTAVVFDGSFVEQCEALRTDLPLVRMWLWVDPHDGTTCPEWATSYEAAAATPPSAIPWSPSGDDLYLLYTGGTTGRPKGVMWRQDDLFCMLEESNGRTVSTEADPEAYAAAVERPGPHVVAAAPLMHGTAAWFSMSALNRAGAVITVPEIHFDPERLLDITSAERARGICIVGDAFARPILRALDADPQRWDLDRLRVIFSSGVMLSAESKRGLLVHAPNAVIVDGLGTSESGSFGRALAGADDDVTTAKFFVGPSTRVLDDVGRDIEPGSGQSGRLAVRGRIPLGYYKDAQKTASTFLEIDGDRYVVAGDWAEVAADGSITLLGRGAGCINTAGEKVYPDEVEEVLKTFPGVADAAVVGVDHERFGQAVVALVELHDDAVVETRQLLDRVRKSLAGYKVPKHVHYIASVGRAANGKLDQASLRALAANLTDHGR